MLIKNLYLQRATQPSAHNQLLESRSLFNIILKCNKNLDLQAGLGVSWQSGAVPVFELPTRGQNMVHIDFYQLQHQCCTKPAQIGWPPHLLTTPRYPLTPNLLQQLLLLFCNSQRPFHFHCSIGALLLRQDKYNMSTNIKRLVDYFDIIAQGQYEPVGNIDHRWWSKKMSSLRGPKKEEFLTQLQM